MSKKVVIVGAGPSGVLLAHYLLRRNECYQVDLYDRLSDPRINEFSQVRTYPISLNERGMSALGQIAGVEAVRAIALEMSGTIFHQHNGRTRVTNRKKPLLTLDRTNLAIALLEQLTKQYDKARFNLYFNQRCTQVNLKAKTVNFQDTALETNEATNKTLTVKYDLLVGADGARSAVRSALLNTELFEFAQKYVPTDYKSIVLPRPSQPSLNLESGKIHSWRSSDGVFVVLLHQLDGSMSGVILFPRENNRVARLANPEAVLQFFHEQFPEVGQLMPASEAEAFLERSPSRILTIRCNRYHHGDSVLIIGDAAHSVSPSIGQGCNAALEDVVIFDRLLDEYKDKWAKAIAQFTVRRLADAHALVELGDYSFPSSPRLFIDTKLQTNL